MSGIVYIHKDDEERMERWIRKYPNLRVQGSLFGLWTPEGNVAVKFVICPGPNSSKTCYSISQDNEYITLAKEFLKSQYMLYHVGEWYSCLQTSHKEPHYDNNIIKKNMSASSPSFLLLIMEVNASHGIFPRPYFVIPKCSVTAGERQILENRNPYMKDMELVRKLGILEKSQKPIVEQYKISSKTEEKESFLGSSESGKCSADRYVSSPLPIPKPIGEKTTRVMCTSMSCTPSDSMPYDASPSLGSLSSLSMQPIVEDTEPEYKIAYGHTERASPPFNHSSGGSSSGEAVGSQWYSSAEGNEILLKVTKLIPSKVEITRDLSTHSLRLEFSYHKKSFVLDFPSDFPKNPVMVAVTDDNGHVKHESLKCQMPFITPFDTALDLVYGCKCFALDDFVKP